MYKTLILSLTDYVDGGGTMNKTMRLAMLNQNRRNDNNRNDNDYRGNQIGFRYNDGNVNRQDYDRHMDYNRRQEYDRYSEYDRRMEAEPIYNRRQRDDNGRYMHYTSKEYDDNVIPMQGYVGIAYTMDNADMSKMDKRQAENWTRHMKNEDGSTGARWTFDEVHKVMQQNNVDCDPVEFYAVMNMLYSDYGKVFKKHDVATMQFYVDMAKAFLEDDDAVKNKLEQYYKYVVKH